MKRECIDQNHEEFNSNLNLKGDHPEDNLEISSTGYGLESVSKETKDEQKVFDSKKRNPSDCGGL